MNMHLSVVLIGAMMLSGISATRYTGTELRNYSARDGNKYVPYPREFEQALSAKLGSEPPKRSAMDKVAKAAKSLLKERGHSSAVEYSAEIFVKLPKVASDCDEASFWVLRDAYVSAHLDQTDLNDGTKTKLAINEALDEHGRKCRSKYMPRFSKLSHKVKFSDVMSRVNQVVSSDDLERIFGELDLKARLRSDDVGTMVGLERAGLTKKWKSMAAGDAKKFFSDKIYTPCLDYYKLTADIFLSARLDLVLDDEKLSEIRPSKEFIDAWLKFRVCDALLYDDTGLVIRAIEKAEP